MSVSPLPVHMGCYGISSDAISAARGYKASSSSYGEKLATVKASMAAQPQATVTSTTRQAAPAGASGSGANPAASSQGAAARQAPQVRLQPLGADQAQSLLSGSGPAHGGGGGAASSAAHGVAYRAHTKHVKVVQPALQSLDFTSIADSSTGGGGVPRPYGRFKACRAGDGNATWQRLPPQFGTWQAKALPIAVTVLTDEEVAAHTAAAAAAASRQSRTHSPGSDVRRPHSHSHPSTRSPSPSHPHDPSAPHSHPHRSGSSRPSRCAPSFSALRGPVPATNPSSVSAFRPPPGLPPAPGAQPQRPAHHDQSYYKRPGSGVHRMQVPLPPPEPANPGAWFALPAATFLTEMPHIPGNIRLDNGFSITREFLQSGLNPPRQPPAQSPRAQPSAIAAATALHPPADQHHQHANPHANPHAPEVALEDKRDLWEALERGAGVLHPSPPLYPPAAGPTLLRGVYVPLDTTRRVQEAEQQGGLSAQASEVVGGLGGGLRPSVGLPPEQHLPRKHMPPGW